jgi:dihydrofolate reductase
MVGAVVVTDLNNAIGRDNKLLCHLPADLKFFKQVTMGSPIIMGRKTYESIGRILPGRRNIIITRKPDYRVIGADIFHSVDAALESCSEDKVFVIGGAEIFRQTMNRLDRIYRTVIQHRFEADTWFPELDEKQFRLNWEQCHDADDRNPYRYCFQEWVRKD